MQIWAETGKSALPIRNYSHILYQFLMFTQNLKRSRFLCTYRLLIKFYTQTMMFNINLRGLHKIIYTLYYALSDILFLLTKTTAPNEATANMIYKA